MVRHQNTQPIGLTILIHLDPFHVHLDPFHVYLDPFHVYLDPFRVNGNAYQAMLLLITATFSLVFLLQSAAKVQELCKGLKS